MDCSKQLAVTIGTNILSLRAQRQLGLSSTALNTTYERLSSGLRINHASDDAAGLAVSTSLRADARIYTQAIKNVNDGVSLFNVAQGALSQLSDITTRVRELSEQSANGVYSTTQRRSIDKEAEQLVQEYNRIISSTSFNGISLFSNGAQGLTIQAGYGTDGSLQFTLGDEISRLVGDGTFGSSGTFTGVGTNAMIKSADINGDGRDDIVSQISAVVTVLLANADGSFAAPISYSGDSSTLAVGDLNNDGKIDVLAGKTVLLGNGDGTFKAKVNVVFKAGYNTNNDAIGDVNGDGIMDVLATASQNDLLVALGNGDGTFKAQTTLKLSAPASLGLTVADINGDGRGEIIAGSAGVNILDIFTMNSDGTFAPRQTIATSGGADATVNDINHDGNLDIVMDSTATKTFQILLGNGDGTFNGMTSLTASNFQRYAQLNDINNDGNLDIVSLNNVAWPSGMHVYLGNGDGSFGAEGNYSAPSTAAYFVMGDFNGDGVKDVAAAQGNAAYFTEWLGNGRDSALLARPDLLRQSTARQTLDSMKIVADRISRELGVIGANSSRLNSALNTLSVARENYMGAASRIEDTDVASEAADLIRLKILQQSSSLVLAQGNLQPQIALKLLGAL